MKSEERRAGQRRISPGKYLVDLLLLLVNSIGMAGALTEILEIPWQEMGKNSVSQAGAMDGLVFWGGVVLFCAAAVVLRSGPSGRKVLKRAFICVIIYLAMGILCRKGLAGGLAMALKNAVENLNEIYEFHIAWNAARLRETAQWEAGVRTLVLTGSVLYVLFPLELLAGVLGRYDKGFCLIAGNALWFTAACFCDRFPGFRFLVFCVLGAVASLVQKEFADRPRTGFAVACCAGLLSCGIMAVIFRFFMPAMDRQYEAMQERRAEFYRLVNEEWIPWVKSALPVGLGSGTDVTGQLGRSHFFAYTAEDMFRVTVDQKPQGTLYLKCFTGGIYGEKEWQPWSDREMETFYEEQGMKLPSDFNTLVNISYEAARELQHQAAPAHIQIRELGGRGRYSIYPYGALLTEDYRVHGDSTVERKNNDYGFAYYFLSGIGGQELLSDRWAEEERKYRQYVYARYLEYPEEELPRLTDCLEKAAIRTGSIYACALDLTDFLGRRASYNLDAGNNPPGTDFVEYFLFDSKEGYCVHFASAAVLALRYFGIPARYAAGYVVSPSDFVLEENGKYRAVVTGRRAHAWAEVYLDRIGWVPVEMTPGAVAFPEDNRMEQLGHLGQLSGEGLMLSENESLWQQDKMTWQNSGLKPSDTVRESTVELEDGREQPEIVDTRDLLSSEKPEERMSEESEEAESDPVHGGNAGNMQSIENTPLTNHVAFRIFMVISAVGLLAASLWCLRKWDESRRREMFRNACTRERIWLLYRNFRRAFRMIGVQRKLNVDGDILRQSLISTFGLSVGEYEEFCRILEKNSFAQEQPSDAEFETLCVLHDRLLEGAYMRASALKRLLLRRYLTTWSAGIRTGTG